MRFLITGGEGFVGKALANKLRAAGHPVDTVDIKGEPTYKVDIVNMEDITNIIHNNNYDGVFHLAAITSPTAADRNPRLAIETNMIGSVNVFEASRNVKKVIFASSSAVYTDKPNMYSMTKKFGEERARSYDNVLSLRYFNVYGPGEEQKGDDRSVITKFIEAAKRGDDLVIFGNGIQRRDFIHVDDVVRRTMDAYNLQTQYSHTDGRYYRIRELEIGTGVSTCFSEIAERIIAMTQSASKITYIPNPFPNYQLYTRAEEYDPWFDPHCISLKDGIMGLIQGEIK